MRNRFDKNKNKKYQYWKKIRARNNGTSNILHIIATKVIAQFECTNVYQYLIKQNVDYVLYIYLSFNLIIIHSSFPKKSQKFVQFFQCFLFISSSFILSVGENNIGAPKMPNIGLFSIASNIIITLTSLRYQKLILLNLFALFISIALPTIAAAIGFVLYCYSNLNS